ncbi:MAG: ECF transporter S component [Firmicutes bacterium]|nr:ECF transporter S component [Bacillota bacterium]
MGVLVLGTRDGAIAAAIGSCLGDILGGFPVWAPWTLVIKGGMALVLAVVLEKTSFKKFFHYKKLSQ